MANYVDRTNRRVVKAEHNKQHVGLLLSSFVISTFQYERSRSFQLLFHRIKIETKAEKRKKCPSLILVVGLPT